MNDSGVCWMHPVQTRPIKWLAIAVEGDRHLCFQYCHNGFVSLWFISAVIRYTAKVDQSDLVAVKNMYTLLFDECEKGWRQPMNLFVVEFK